MRRQLEVAVVVVLALSMGCSLNPGNGGGTSAGGSVGLSRDDALLYAADPDLDTVFVVDTKTRSVLHAIKVGRRPEKVLVASDGTAFVTNRMGRSVSVIRPGDSAESTRIPVGVEPVGLALARDDKTLYVVNSTSLTDPSFGTLQAIDTQSLATRFEVPVGAEPRGVTLLGDGRAVVTLYKTGDLALVDLAKGKVLTGGTTLHDRLNATVLGKAAPSGGTASPTPLPPNRGFGPATVQPVGLEAVLASPDGTQVYAPSLLATDTQLDVRSQVGTQSPSGVDNLGAPSAGYGGGSCGATSVAAPAMLTLDDSLTPQVDDMGSCLGGDTSLSRPPTVLSTIEPGTPIQGPSAVAMDPTGSFLFVANRESNNVAVISTATRNTPNGTTLDGQAPEAKMGGLRGGNLAALVPVGAGPTGIAVTHDGATAWVYNAFDHSLTRIARVEQNGVKQLVAQPALTLSGDVLPADVVAGRKLFFSAVDPRMDSPFTGISCATCHLEGREDGHVWNFTDGPRQTPSLAGRALDQTAPYHWSGEFSDFSAFMLHTTQRRMGGSGATDEMARQLSAFLFSLEAPDNPMREAAPKEQVARGQAAFQKAECGTCHAGAAFTNNGFSDVGTLVTGGSVIDDVSFLPQRMLNVPSLLGVARSAPYLHDGSATTLKERLLHDQGANRHGTTSVLNDREIDDLVVYLQTL